MLDQTGLLLLNIPILFPEQKIILFVQSRVLVQCLYETSKDICTTEQGITNQQKKFSYDAAFESNPGWETK